MNTLVWGPSAWLFLHSIALAYPGPASKEAYRSFFSILGEVLPCTICQKHYSENFKDIGEALDSRDALFRWTVDMHNRVNRSLGKPILTYTQALATLAARYDGHKKEWWPYVVTFIGLLVIALVAMLVHSSCRGRS